MPQLSVAQALRLAVPQLKNAGISTPHLDAELLLAHCLQVERPALIAHPEYQLTTGQQARFRELLARRLRREPLAYLIHERWFYGLKLYVDSSVLIPRPETEMLVEAALNWLRGNPSATVVDVGTGSGAIAVALACHAPPAARILATDISADALRVARRNTHIHGVATHIALIQTDLLQALAPPLHLIVANLPYVASRDRDALIPEVRDYEPGVALFAGPEGLDLLDRCLAQARQRLAAGGLILQEIGYVQGSAVQQLAQQHFPAANISIHQDLAGLERMVSIQT